MLRLTLEIDGQVQLDRAIARFTEGMTDFRHVWPAVTEEFHAIEEKLFATEGKSSGNPWKELSPAYAGWKEKKIPAGYILQFSRRLQRSLTGPGGDAVNIPEAMSLTLGTRDPKALYHQRGGGRLPQRKVIDLSEEDKKALMRAVQRKLVQRVRKTGFEVDEEARAAFFASGLEGI